MTTSSSTTELDQTISDSSELLHKILLQDLFRPENILATQPNFLPTPVAGWVSTLPGDFHELTSTVHGTD